MRVNPILLDSVLSDWDFTASSRRSVFVVFFFLFFFTRDAFHLSSSQTHVDPLSAESPARSWFGSLLADLLHQSRTKRDCADDALT